MLNNAKELQEKEDELRKRIRDRQLKDVEKVLELPEGRRLLWRILEESRIMATCFSDNTHTMAYYEGKRDIGLFILNEATTVNKNAFSKMQNEYFSELGKNKRG